MSNKIGRLKVILQLYGKLLYLALNNSKTIFKDFVLVDYGGGSGLISFLAAEVGIGTIIYNDIYDVSCADVERLSTALDYQLNHIVCGDVDELVSYLNKNRISINAITSHDVLEHIYDVESHFRSLSGLSYSTFRIVYASGANIANRRYVRSVTKKQIEAEYENRERKWGHKDRDSLRSYLDMRKNITTKYAPELSSEIVERLARYTRGLIQRDIQKSVDEFRSRGTISYQITHPTNTCDPLTGNWCEHLMIFDWLQHAVENTGFSIKIIPGSYITYGSVLKRIIKRILNAVIKLLGRNGMFKAPYYILYADIDQ